MLSFDFNCISKMKALHAKCIFLCITFISIFENVYLYKKPFSVIFLQTYTFRNPEYLSRYNITILPKAPGSTLTVNIDIIRDFTLKPMMKIMVFMQTGSNYMISRNVFTFDFDFCNLFGRNEERTRPIFDINVGNVLDIWVNNMKKYGNMPTCPVKQGSYSVEDLRVDKKGIPNFLPLGRYRVNVTFYFKDTQPQIVINDASIDIELRNRY